MKKKILIAALLLLLAVLGSVGYFGSQYEPAKEFDWGVTFSHSYAQYLGYDWRVVYLDMLNDLKPKKLRLMAYWEDIEPEPERYNFQVAAEMIAEAQKRDIDVMLVVGHKQPRWPECHHPGWYNGLSQQDKEAAQLRYVKNAVNYYKQVSAIKVWQVENEALFGFGDQCPIASKDLLLREMALVRSLDSRPILMADSGEFGRWLPTINLGPDLFGSTMYRVVHNPKVGYFKYPLPPYFFHVKAGMAKKFTNMDEGIIGVELQGEPWFANGADGPRTTDLNTQYALMNPKIFNEYVQYAKDVGFRENYLWGVEWWYWLAHEKGDWGMWDAAKQVFAQ
jgi:hypothetical protein